MQELWTELSQAWPAIKSNPETAENIEKLWQILKASGNNHIEISKEIQSLLGNSSVTTGFSNNTSLNQSNTTSGIKSAVTSTASLNNDSQPDDDIDSLLAEILGDDYKNDISHFSSKTNNDESKTASNNVSNNSGTEELDKLVAAILGDDWLNEESAASSNIPSTDKQAAKTIQSADASESSNLIFETDHNIDNLVSSIIADDSNNNQAKPLLDDIRAENQKLINDKQNIDKLLDNILNEDDSDENIITKSKANLDDIFSLNINTAAKQSSNNNGDFINDVASKDTGVDSTTSSLSNITNKEHIQTIPSQQEEDVDSLLDDIINRSSTSESTVSNLSNIANDEQSITTESKSEENIDDLINDIINKDTGSESITPNTSSITNEELIETTDLTPKEDINDLINDILNKDTGSESVTSDLSSIANEELIETTASEPEEDIDALINGIISKDIDSENIISDLSNITNEEPIKTTGSKTEENIEDLINDILNDKTESKAPEESSFSEESTADTSKNSSFQPVSTHKTRKVAPAPVIKTPDSSSSYKQSEKQGSNSTLLIIILIILLLACIGIWMLFFNNEESTQETILQETYTSTTIVEDSPAVEEIMEETKPEDTASTYQYKPEIEYTPATTESATNYIEPDSSISSYYAPAETTNADDITITLNTPETAIAASDSTIFNESENVTIVEITPLVDDNINAIEKIVETTAPTETLGANELVLKEPTIEKVKIEKVKKENPIKAVARRKIITHVIVKGDTLWAIAKRYVNNPYHYPELARLSKIQNPDRIYPGNKVKIIIYIK